MSHKRPKEPKNQPHADPHEDSSETKSTKHHVYVESGVKIDLVDELKQQQKSQQDDATAQQRKQLRWTQIAAGLILLYTAFSGWQLKVARDTFNTANRPYVGINAISVAYLPPNVTNLEQLGDMPTSDTVALSIRVEIKNFGPVPATGYNNHWRVFIGGVVQPIVKVPGAPSTLFPGQTVFLTGNTGRREYPAIQNGEKTLAIEVSVDYLGPSGHYTNCQREQYAPKNRAFLSSGSSVLNNPAALSRSQRTRHHVVCLVY